MCCRMREEEERIMVKTYLGVAHGRATFGTGRPNLLRVCWVGFGTVWHGRAIFGTGPAKSLDAWLQNFHLFSNHAQTITYKTT